MAKHCAKHDITGDECWNCEEQELNASGDGAREAAYSDPAFLAKRGGATSVQVHQSAAMHKLSQLSPDELDNLIASARLPGGKRQPIALSPAH